MTEETNFKCEDCGEGWSTCVCENGDCAND